MKKVVGTQPIPQEEPKDPALKWRSRFEAGLLKELDSVSGWSRAEDDTGFLVNMPGRKPPMKVNDADPSRHYCATHVSFSTNFEGTNQAAIQTMLT